VPLLCLPFAGGSASFYFQLSAALAPDVQVLAVQLPGRQDRRAEAALDDIDTIVDSLFRATKDVLGGGATAMFGISMGAVLGFELARVMESRLGAVPQHLFVSGRRAPSRIRDEWVHRLGDDGLVEHVIGLGAANSEILNDPEMRAVLLPALRGDYRAIERYRALSGATVGCPVTVLHGSEDPRTTAAEADQWRLHTRAVCRVRTLPGGHFLLNQFLADVTGEIRSVLT
jgi:pyochelin biosynthetic protein PchC